MLSKKILAILIACFLLSCEKSDEFSLAEPEIHATVKDLTGLDGCGIVLELDNGKKLEIVSLPPNTSLIPNRRVAITYNTLPMGSICMVGLTVEITSLRYL